MDLEKLQIWAKQIHENATAHGWHEKPMSDYHWLMMVVTEVSEAVEADRKNRRLDIVIKEAADLLEGDFVGYYDFYVKGTLEEELADIVIRILDFTYEKFGDKMNWKTIKYLTSPFENRTFTEIAYRFIRITLGSDAISIASSVHYIYQWAALYDIDLDWSIEAKMRYNETRPYKHGDKKY